MNKKCKILACNIPAEYDDGLSIDIPIYPEFDSPRVARIQAEKFADTIGRISNVR